MLSVSHYLLVQSSPPSNSTRLNTSSRLDDGSPLTLYSLRHLLRILLHISSHRTISFNNETSWEGVASFIFVAMDLAKTLIRSVVRAFYDTPFVLVIDALMLHSAFVLAHQR